MRVKIDHIGAGGDGVALGPTGPIYVPYAAAGDDIEVKIQAKQGRISHIYAPSPDRVAPICSHFGRCGGCALQHVSNAYYTHWKQQQIRIALSHRGFNDVTVLPTKMSALGSRRRARFSVMGHSKGVSIVGFAERASHDLVNILECPVLDPVIMNVIAPLRKFLGNRLTKGQKMAVQINRADNGLDIIIEGMGDPDLDMRMDIAEFAETRDIARICWQNIKLKNPSPEILCERRKPYVTFDGRKIFLPPGAFLQATKASETALSEYVKAALVDSDKIVDLFSGCGTFAVALVADHVVHGVDGNKDMVDGLKNSYRQMGPHMGQKKEQLRILTTEARDLYKRPLLPHELAAYDAAVIDPPRAGARDQIEEITQSAINALVMISCNPATFARDARVLVDAGFVMGDILPVDQFLYSPHIELVTVFRRNF